MKLLAYTLLVTSVLLCASCHKEQPTFQPVTLEYTGPSGSSSVFVPTDITSVRPTISSNPIGYAIWFQLSPAALDRWSRLPDGVEFTCKTKTHVIGVTKVEHTIGSG